MSRNTLVVHTGALGDFLLACPAIELLAKEGGVELVGHPERHTLAVAAGIAARAHPLDAIALHEVLAAASQACTPGPPPQRFARFVQGFDRAVVWMRDPGGVLERAFRSAGIEDLVLRPGLPQSDWPGHASAYYLDTLGAPPIDVYSLNFAPIPGLDVVIAPGSGSPKKNWPLERFLELANRLEGRGRDVTWLLGPAEGALRLPASAKILREPELPALAGLLAGAKAFIGNDSGATHLASLCRCPTLAIFCITNKTQWRPIGVSVHILSRSVWPDVDDVERAFARMNSEAEKNDNT